MDRTVSDASTCGTRTGFVSRLGICRTIPAGSSLRHFPFNTAGLARGGSDRQGRGSDYLKVGVRRHVRHVAAPKTSCAADQRLADTASRASPRCGHSGQDGRLWSSLWPPKPPAEATQGRMVGLWSRLWPFWRPLRAGWLTMVAVVAAVLESRRARTSVAGRGAERAREARSNRDRSSGGLRSYRRSGTEILC